MLLNNFFFIDSITQEDEKIFATIHVEVAHSIFQGHFPEQPLVPGVCMLEMLKSVLENALNVSLLMQTASSIKFLNMFIPTASVNASFEITCKKNDDEKFVVQATLKNEESIYLKFQGVFIQK